MQATVNLITSGWKTKPPIEIVATQDQLPPELGVSPDDYVLGLSDGKTAYLVAENLATPLDVAQVLTEELFHRGLASSLGSKYNSELDRVYRKRGQVSGLLNTLKKYGGDQDQFLLNYRPEITRAQAGDKEAQREVADEVLAQLAQLPNLPKSLRQDLGKAVAKLKQFLRKYLPDDWFTTVSDADLLLMVSQANQAGKLPSNSDTRVVRFSKLRPGEYFGTDENGNQRIYKVSEEGSREVLSRTQELRNLAALRYTKPDSGIRQAIFNSKAWGGIMRTIANSSFDSQVLENAFQRSPANTADLIWEELNNTENPMPELLQQVFDGADNPNRRRNLMSLNSSLLRYSSSAVDAVNRELSGVGPNGESPRQVIDNLTRTQRALMAVEKTTPEQQEIQSSRYLTAKHAPERNDISWLKSVKLTAPNAIKGRRKQLMEAIVEGVGTVENLQEVREIVQEYAKIAREDWNGSGMLDREASEVLANIGRDPAKLSLYEDMAEASRAMQTAINNINRKTGSFSRSLEKTINLYGWKNYVPLQGKDEALADSDIGGVVSNAHADSVFAQGVRAFEGRSSLTNSVLANQTRTLLNAAERYTAQEPLQSVAAHVWSANNSAVYGDMLSDIDGFGGMMRGTVETFDINSKGFKSKLAKAPRNMFVLYDKDNDSKENQEALVIELFEDKGADAILGARSETLDNVDNWMRTNLRVGDVNLHDVTSFVGSLKTYRSVPFIPWDAVRNLVTLAPIAGAEAGASGAKAYLGMALKSPGWGRDLTRYVMAYQRGDFEAVDSLVEGSGPNSVLRDIDEFYKLGGPVNLLAAFSNDAGTLQSLSKERLAGKRERVKLSVDEFFSTANLVADQLSRISLYKALKDSGETPEIAAARVKRTANFESTGTATGPLSGVLAFFRATAVSATDQVNTLLNSEFGPQTAAAMAGAGVSMYILLNAMSGQDDEDQDRLANVNGVLFNNALVFKPDDGPGFQVPMGFGPFFSLFTSGVQMARHMLGHQGVEDTLNNIVATTTNSVKLVPVSGISVLESPTDFLLTSTVPTVLQPMDQASRNLNSLGLEIRSSFDGAESGDITSPFAGRYNSEGEVYAAIANFLRDGAGINMNPDDIKHYSRGYLGTIAYLGESVFENYHAATSDEDTVYNYKQGWYLARQFIPPDYTQNSNDFYRHVSETLDLDKQIKSYAKEGLTEKADNLRQNPRWAEYIELATEADKERRAINKRYRDAIRSEVAGTAEVRQTRDARQEELSNLYLSYLRAIGER